MGRDEIRFDAYHSAAPHSQVWRETDYLVLGTLNSSPLTSHPLHWFAIAGIYPAAEEQGHPGGGREADGAA